MTATTLGLSQTEYVVLGILWMASLVPVVWAIADMARRPVWQFPRSRKARATW
ncbi:MAG: hypothetical protein M0Z95_00735 [Actinomycetota bacterium]|nr:hypothetical protein [Actinomycetota bacterium]